jgi:hypothetical protein
MSEIIDFGDNCLPHILIRDILFLKQKTLFTLGVFDFNDILKYFKNEDMEDIFKKEYLTYDNKPIDNFYDKYKFYTQSPKIINKKFNFGFLHHFNYDVSNNCINNYDFVVEQFKNRINDFKNILKNEKKIIFVNFSFYNSLKNMKIDEMINTLNTMINKNYYMIIFLYDYKRLSNNINDEYDDFCRELFQKHNNIKIIFLKSDFTEWWNQDTNVKRVLYGEICEGFLKACSELNITIYK